MTNKGSTSTGTTGSTQPTMPSGNLASFAVNQSDGNSPDENSSTDNAPSDNPGAFALTQRVEKSSAGNQPNGDVRVSNVDDVRIIADKANNAVVVVATPRAYQTILPVIQQLDVLPLQVLIDASVVSVKLTDNLQYGIEWFLRQGDTAVGSNLGNELGGIDLGNMAHYRGQGLWNRWTLSGTELE